MVLRVHRQFRGMWLLAGLLAAWIIGKFILQRMGSQVEILDPMILGWLVGWISSGWRGQQLTLSGPVLRFSQGHLVESIPLAAAEVKLLKKGWQIRWQRGRTATRRTFHTSDEFRDAVIAAVELASQAEINTVPRTEREAAQAVPLLRRVERRTYTTWIVLGCVGSIALATWLNQPLCLLPIPLMYGLSEQLFSGTSILLWEGHLYFMGEEGPIHQVPLASVQSVTAVGENRIALELSDPRYPRVQLTRFFWQVDGLAQIRRAMAGQPLFKPEPSAGGEESVG